MTRPEARALLDAARCGANVCARRITEALRVTGDLDDDAPDAPVQMRRMVGSWERRASGLAVAGPFDGLLA